MSVVVEMVWGRVRLAVADIPTGRRRFVRDAGRMGRGGGGHVAESWWGGPPPAGERLARLGDQPGILAFTEKIFCVLGVVCLCCFAWAAMVSGALGCVGTVMRSA